MSTATCFIASVLTPTPGPYGFTASVVVTLTVATAVTMNAYRDTTLVPKTTLILNNEPYTTRNLYPGVYVFLLACATPFNNIDVIAPQVPNAHIAADCTLVSNPVTVNVISCSETQVFGTISSSESNSNYQVFGFDETGEPKLSNLVKIDGNVFPEGLVNQNQTIVEFEVNSVGGLTVFDSAGQKHKALCPTDPPEPGPYPPVLLKNDTGKAYRRFSFLFGFGLLIFLLLFVYLQPTFFVQFGNKIIRGKRV